MKLYIMYVFFRLNENGRTLLTYLVNARLCLLWHYGAYVSVECYCSHREMTLPFK